MIFVWFLPTNIMSSRDASLEKCKEMFAGVAELATLITLIAGVLLLYLLNVICIIHAGVF